MKISTFRTLTLGTIGENAAHAEGGGIYNLGDVRLRSSVVYGSWAAEFGGGLYERDEDGGTHIVNSTFSGNQAGNAGGGLFNHSGNEAGRILQFDQRGPGYPRYQTGDCDMGAFEF